MRGRILVIVMDEIMEKLGIEEMGGVKRRGNGGFNRGEIGLLGGGERRETRGKG